MLQPDMSPPKYGFDLLSLPLADWNDPDTLPSIRRLADYFLSSNEAAELTLVAPRFMSRGFEQHFLRPRCSAYFVPVPALLPPRIYFQQVVEPLLFRMKGVNRIVSFGHGVPTAYPAPKILALLPGQSREWWRMIPSLLTADAVVTDSESQKISLESRLTKLKSRVEVIPPAVGEEYHPYPKDAGRELFERRGVKGRFALYFGLGGALPSLTMVALEAFAKIAHRPRMKSVQFIVVGSSGLALIPLKKRVEELELSHRVCFMDEIAATEWPLWLSSAQFAICPEEHEMFLHTLLKALGSGCPMIVPTEKLKETFVHEAILTCQVSDPKSLAETMTRVLAEPELRDALVKEGLEVVSRRGWNARGEKFLGLFESLASQRERLAEPATAKPDLMAG